MKISCYAGFTVKIIAEKYGESWGIFYAQGVIYCGENGEW